VGFEPTNGGFADLSLGPLGYRAESPSITIFAPGLHAAAAICPRYFFAGVAGVSFASRRNRADSSGGVGLM
jgi:hypothetical protein